MFALHYIAQILHAKGFDKRRNICVKSFLYDLTLSHIISVTDRQTDKQTYTQQLVP